MVAAENPNKKSWQSNIEPGLLADALETNSDDVLRIALPSDRRWFSPKVEIPTSVEKAIQGEGPESIKEQRLKSAALACLMSQQHLDTGFRENVKMSIKEAYKHGSFVAEVRFLEFPKWYGDGRQEKLGAAVWVPHSMWNCYPAPTGTVQASSLSYQGSMIVKTKMTWADFMNDKRLINKEKVKKTKADERRPLDVIKFFGDIYLQDKELFLPNMEVWVVDETLVYAKENELPYPPIIFGSIEKDDVNDDYASSQLIKRSPTHKAAASALNAFIDSTALSSNPPVAYSALDPKYAAEGGVIIEPGAEVPTRGRGEVAPIYVSDPAAAFNGYQVLKQEVERGTNSDVRAGVAPSTEQTRFEIQKIQQRAETRTVDFVGVLERHGLRPFLYMQHEYNKKKLSDYPFYCNEPNLPTFLRASKQHLNELIKNVAFEITGSVGVLGEEERRQGTVLVTQQIMSTEKGQMMMGEAGLAEVFRDMYADVGVKDPDRYLPNAPDIDENGEVEKVAVEQLEALEGEMNAALQEMQEVVGTLQRENFELSEALERGKTDQNVLAEDNKLLEEQIQTIERSFQKELEIMQKSQQLQKEADKLERAKQELKNAEQNLNRQADTEKEKIKAQQQSAQKMPEVDLSALDSLKEEVAELNAEADQERADRAKITSKVLNYLKSRDGAVSEFASSLEEDMNEKSD